MSFEGHIYVNLSKKCLETLIFFIFETFYCDRCIHIGALEHLGMCTTTYLLTKGHMFLFDQTRIQDGSWILSHELRSLYISKFVFLHTRWIQIRLYVGILFQSFLLIILDKFLQIHIYSAAVFKIHADNLFSFFVLKI